MAWPPLLDVDEYIDFIGFPSRLNGIGNLGFKVPLFEVVRLDFMKGFIEFLSIKDGIRVNAEFVLKGRRFVLMVPIPLDLMDDWFWNNVDWDQHLLHCPLLKPHRYERLCNHHTVQLRAGILLHWRAKEKEERKI